MKNNKNIFILGITLFGMFFGAGNLIFPAFLGYESGGNFILSIIGFMITAVVLPMVAINIIVDRKSMLNLAGSISPLFASALTFLIYVTIGPLLAIPRTSSVSFAIAVQPFLKEGGDLKLYILLYSIVFFTLSSIVALKPEKLTNFLGRITTPTLIVLIVAIFLSSIINNPEAGVSSVKGSYKQSPLFTGFLDGYQTMDTIAALNFGIIFMFNVISRGFSKFEDQKSVTKKASIIAGSFLTIIYLFLGIIGVLSPLKTAVNGTDILTYAVESRYGHFGLIILAIVFVLACFNTCTSLLCCVSEYFHEIMPKVSYRKWLVFFAVLSALISNAGLNVILKISVPILQAIYPLAITLILMGILSIDKRADLKLARIISMSFVGFFSVIPQILNLFGIESFFASLPLYSIGLVWVIPMIIGFLIGKIIFEIKRKNLTE